MAPQYTGVEFAHTKQIASSQTTSNQTPKPTINHHLYLLATMKFTINPQLEVAIITLAGVARCAPTSVSPRSSPAVVFHRDLARRDANCPMYSGWGSFPKDNAPLLEDCEVLRDTLTGSRNWSLNADTVERELGRFETCSFTLNNPAAEYIQVGEEDLYTVLNNSISGVGRHGHLQVEGDLYCKLANGETDFNFGVHYKISNW